MPLPKDTDWWNESRAGTSGRVLADRLVAVGLTQAERPKSARLSPGHSGVKAGAAASGILSKAQVEKYC